MPKQPQDFCPYSGAPAQARWTESVARRPSAAVDPHFAPTPFIDRTSRVVSAGSCFAQHISRYLQRWGYNYWVTEPGPVWLDGDDRRAENYGVFSARYGNIYTSLQLLQLFRRAFGDFTPAEPLWPASDGKGFVDPFRPRVQPGGFAGRDECLRDRAEHLACVRRLFSELDVFVFTLGLTEGWRSQEDGAVFPVAPGCGAGGVFDPERHAFVNFTAGEVTAHLREFMQRLLAVNPKATVIFTVSPVPLVATYERNHVLAATVYSKSVLRVAAEETVRAFPQARYFASYEIVTATGAPDYFLEDRRTVTEAAVSHVMGVFLKNFCLEPPVEAPALLAEPISGAVSPPPAAEIVICDEEAILGRLAAATP
jgi:hypothetical protein